MTILKFVIIAAICQFVAGSTNSSISCDSKKKGLSSSCPGKSCDAIYQINELTRGKSGFYHVMSTVHKVYCDMGLECGGYKGGWMRIADIDTRRKKSKDSCPKGWGSISSPFAACRSKSNDPGCSSTSFSVNGASYRKICGKARGYQKDTTDAFGGPRRQRGSSTFDYIIDINDAYVDGLSITIGSPRQHVWTFSSGNNDNNSAFVDVSKTTDEHTCPCAAVPGLLPFAFVRNDYYCESGSNGGNPVGRVDGIYTADALWDGSGCDGKGDNCCTAVNQPWFFRQFSTTQKSDIEARICADENWANEGVIVDQLQLFVL